MEKIQGSVEHYREVSSTYDQTMRSEGELMDLLEKKAFRQMVSPSAKKNVLDLGCGTGRFSFFLLQEGFKQVLGIDSSPEMIALANAKKKSEAIEFCVMDVNAFLNGVSEKHGFITAAGLLSFVDANSFFKGLSKKTMPDGFLFFDFVNTYNLFAKIKFFSEPVKRTFYSYGQIRKLLEQNGFEIQSERGIYFFPAPKRFIEKNRWLKNLWLQIDPFLGSLPLFSHIFAYRIFILAKKRGLK